MKMVTIKAWSGKIPTRDYKNKAKDLKTVVNSLNGQERKIVEPDTDPKNLVHFSNISNMVHVLMGVRPAPAKRASNLKRNPYIDEIVSRGVFRITNTIFKTYTLSDGTEKMSAYKEVTQGKKPFHNANLPISTKDPEGNMILGNITWSAMRKKAIYSPGYDELMTEIQKEAKVLGLRDLETNYTFIELLYELRKHSDVVERLKEVISRTGTLSTIGNYILSQSVNAAMQSVKSPNLAAIAVDKFTLHKISVDGEVILFLKDEDAEIINNGTRCATFLDGGVAIVESIEDIDNEFAEDFKEDNCGEEFNDFKKIKDLSL